MRNKFLFISVLLVLTVLLSACLSPSGGGPAVAPAPVTPRTVSVNGTGQVSLKPDIAYIYMGVHTEKPSAAEAVAVNNTSTQKLVEALKATGIAAEDIRTSNFSIWQNQQYDPQTGKPSSTNYVVDNTVYVTVRDLAKLGDLLDAAVGAGANNVNSIQFDVADKAQALSEARKAAVEAAKKQAAELAEAAGVKLGDIQSVQYFDSSPVPVVEGKGIGGGGAVSADVSVPINPGQLQITATVTINFEIK